MNAQAHFGEYLSLYCGHVENRVFIRHQACGIVIALRENFLLESKNEARLLSFAVVPSLTTHRITKGNQLLCIFIEPHLLFSKIHVQLNNKLTVRYRSFQKDLLQLIRDTDNLHLSTLCTWIENRPEFIYQPIDNRVNQVQQFIRQNLRNSFSVSDLAENMHLSESRLQHLFKKQVGVPIIKYIHWQRLKLACESVMAGASITEAAHNAMFADSAHFSRMFSQMFGMTPREIFRQ